MSELEDKVSNLESLFLKRQEEKKKKCFNKLFERCVFCMDDFTDKLGAYPGKDHNSHLIAEEVARRAYQLEQGITIPRVSDPDQCFHDKNFRDLSVDVSYFIAHTIDSLGKKEISFRDGFLNIDPFDPRDVFPILADFDNMDLAFDKHLEITKPRRFNSFESSEEQLEGTRISIKEIKELVESYARSHEKNIVRRFEQEEVFDLILQYNNLIPDYLAQRVVGFMNSWVGILNLDEDCKIAKRWLRSVGKEWLLSLNWQNYDIRLLEIKKIVKKYSPHNDSKLAS